MNRDFIGALLQLNAEKGVPQEILIQTLEQAIESAYRRNADAPENVVVHVDPESGEISVYREYEVVAGEAEIEDPELQMVVADAQKIDSATGVGGKVRVPENVTQAQLGRIAAQTAGQVYRQRLREAERDVVYSQYASREGEIMTGVVHRTTDQAVVLDMGKGVEAVLAVTRAAPDGALPHRAAPEGLRAGGAPHDARAGAGGEPHASGLPASPDGDGDPRDL